MLTYILFNGLRPSKVPSWLINIESFFLALHERFISPILCLNLVSDSPLA